MVRTKESVADSTLRIGLLVPFASRAGSTWYAGQIRRCFPESQLVILAEDQLESSPDAIHCWSRSSTDFSRLEQVLVRESIQVLHIVTFRPFFEPQAFQSFLQRQKSRGIRVLVDVFTNVNAERGITLALREADLVLVPATQKALELSATGVPWSKLRIVNQGNLQVDAGATTERAPNTRVPTILTFTDGLPSQSLEQLISTVQSLQAKISTELLIVPLESVVHASGADYRKSYLDELRARSAIIPGVRVFDRWAGCADLTKLVSLASCVVFTAAEPVFEVQQALSAAFFGYRPVITTDHSTFSGHAERVLYTSEHIPLSQAVLALLTNDELRGTLTSSAAQWVRSYTLNEYVDQLVAVYLELAEGQERAPSQKVTTVSTKANSKRAPKILMQSRENIFSQPGGDTVVLERLSAELKTQGFGIDVDTENKLDPRSYDLVHLFNFALRDQTLALAKNCQQLGVPYVVTTLYEDWPLFFNQMQAQCSALEKYIQSGQNPTVWTSLHAEARKVKPAPIWDNSLSANHAEALIATGDKEAAALTRDYPAVKRVEICPLAANETEYFDNGELFFKETGLRDFVFCVGRFELRKNQLMLLKALEDCELTLVFAGGGFSYQPVYADLCRKFRRRGKTVFLDRLEPNMLASAFQAARVHALPGWLELPGLVSLEAAAYGRNVVVSDYGTARDYLGEDAYYCDPSDPQSIANAVQAGYYAPVKPELQTRARSFTWQRTAACMGSIYRNALQEAAHLDWSLIERVPPVIQQAVLAKGSEQELRHASFKAQAAGRSVGLIPVMVGEVSDGPQKLTEAKRLCEDGDTLAKSGDLIGGRQKFTEAIKVAPHFARGHRALGAILMIEKNVSEAEKSFHKALELDQEDNKALIGLGTAQWELGKKEDAFGLFLKAAKQQPSDSLAILHLVRTGYALNRLEELEQSLRAFLQSDPDNSNVLYCLAGCSYKRGRLNLALGVVERILRLDPVHANALELRDQIQADRNKLSPSLAHQSEPVHVEKRFDVDELIGQLDIMKRNREYDAVLRESARVLQSTHATPLQIGRAKAFRAEALAYKGELEEAEALFLQIESIFELSARAIAGRGAIIASRGDFKTAERMFRLAMEKNPSYDVAIAGLGVVATHEGNSEEAWTFFQRALSINPENLRALYGIIQLGYLLQRLPETAQALETYLDLRPVDLAINYSYAGCCYALNQFDKAKAELQKILIFEPHHELALELLAKIEEAPASNVAHAG